jgi:excinuclease UvrABC ATPase subunit
MLVWDILHLVNKATLSGSEAQRIKLAGELSAKDTETPLYFR